MNSYDFGIPSTGYNVILVFGIIFSIIWMLRLAGLIIRALRLRAGIMTGNVVYLRGLRDNSTYFNCLSTLHTNFVKLIRQSAPPVLVKRIYVPVHIEKIIVVNNSLELIIWAAQVCNIRFFDGFDSALLREYEWEENQNVLSTLIPRIKNLKVNHSFSSLFLLILHVPA